MRSGLALRMGLGLAMCWCASGAFAVSIAAGPFYNSVTGHRYYRLTGGNWNSLRSFAVSMGGDLATINDAAENAWVRANVVGSGSKPFIGLNDASLEGTLVWADGTASAYRNWRAGEPNNNASNDYVNFDGTPEGTWAISQLDYSGEAIVEIAAGPIHVPVELPTLVAAVNAQPTSGTSEIIIAPGTYSVDSQVNASNVSIRGAGRGQTILLGTFPVPAGSTIYYTIQLNGGCLVEDMTIVNRSPSPSLAAETGINRVRRVEFTSQPDSADADLVQNNFSNSPDLAPTLILENCELHDSVFALDNNSGTMLISGSIFRDLGSVSATTQQNTVTMIANCVIARCGLVFDASGTKKVENTIFYGLTNTMGGGSSLTLRNCNTSFPGTGNFSGSARFVDPEANDFRLQADSPCIDRGNVTAYMECQPQELTDIAGNDRVVDDAGHANFYSPKMPIDVGAFEFDGGASCPGDLNHDAMVDDADFQLFLVGYNALLCP